MYLKEWKPIFKKVLGAMHGDISLCFKAKLQCPLCKIINGVITSGHVVNPRDFSRTVDDKVNELAQHRGCVKCGVVSTLPQDDFQRLRREAKLLITAERVQKESDRLYGRKAAA